MESEKNHIQAGALERAPPAEPASSKPEEHNEKAAESGSKTGHKRRIVQPGGTIDAEGEDEANEFQISTLRSYAILLSCSLVSLSLGFGSTSPVILLPDLTGWAPSAYQYYGWFSGAYFLAAAGSIPIFNRFYTQISIKWTLFAAVWMFAAGNVIVARASTPIMFIAGRAVAGLGLAGGYLGSTVISSMIVPLGEDEVTIRRTRHGFFLFGAAVGPVVGGQIAYYVENWRWIFWANTFFAPPSLLLILVSVKLPTRRRTHSARGNALERLLCFSWIEAVLILGSLICLSTACQLGGSSLPWSNKRVVGLIAGAILIALAFVLVQIFVTGGDHVFLPSRLLRDRTIGFGALTAFFTSAVFFTLAHFLPIYFESVRSDDLDDASTNTLAFFLATFCMYAFVPFIVLGSGGVFMPILVLGTVWIAVGTGLHTAFKFDSGDHLTDAGQIIAGIGIGMSWMIPFTAAMNTVIVDSDHIAGLSIILFAKFLAPAIFLPTFHAVFLNGLFKGAAAELLRPVIGYGFNGLVYLPGGDVVVEHANAALRPVFVGTTVLAVLGFVCVLGMRFERVRAPHRCNMSLARA